MKSIIEKKMSDMDSLYKGISKNFRKIKIRVKVGGI